MKLAKRWTSWNIWSSEKAESERTIGHQTNPWFWVTPLVDAGDHPPTIVNVCREVGDRAGLTSRVDRVHQMLNINMTWMIVLIMNVCNIALEAHTNHWRKSDQGGDQEESGRSPSVTSWSTMQVWFVGRLMSGDVIDHVWFVIQFLMIFLFNSFNHSSDQSSSNHIASSSATAILASSASQSDLSSLSSVASVVASAIVSAEAEQLKWRHRQRLQSWTQQPLRPFMWLRSKSLEQLSSSSRMTNQVRQSRLHSRIGRFKRRSSTSIRRCQLPRSRLIETWQGCSSLTHAWLNTTSESLICD